MLLNFFLKDAAWHKSELKSIFKILNFGPLKYFHGVLFLRKRNCVFHSQSAYYKLMLKEIGRKAEKSASTNWCWMGELARQNKQAEGSFLRTIDMKPLLPHYAHPTRLCFCN